MDSQWREKKLYPIFGIISIFALIYFNLSGNITLPTIFYCRQPYMSFVGVNSTRFVLLPDHRRSDLPPPEDPVEVYVNGWNSYWLLQESVWADSRNRVSEMMKRGEEMGLTVCRTWAFSDGGPNPLQISPGVFDEQVFQGLDFIIVEARKHQIRLILSLVNNLEAFGGKTQYVKWAQKAGYNISSSTDSFFSHPIIKDYYKAFVKAIITRKNSLSGVKYSEEPAIFAWELINEPRCDLDTSAPVLEAWITEMAAFVKSLDPKHLVTVGLEGFYGLKTSENSTTVNPGKWAASLGSDFLRNSATDNIDFASVHAYPHSWLPGKELEVKIDYLSRWVDAHIRDGENLLKKPVLFTEVGSPLRVKQQGSYDRDVVLQTVYNKIYESAKKGGAGAGALVWQLLVEGLEDYSDRFSFIAKQHPSTYKLIVQQSCRLRNLAYRGETSRKIFRSDRCSG